MGKLDGQGCVSSYYHIKSNMIHPTPEEYGVEGLLKDRVLLVGAQQRYDWATIIDPHLPGADIPMTVERAISSRLVHPGQFSVVILHYTLNFIPARKLPAFFSALAWLCLHRGMYYSLVHIAVHTGTPCTLRGPIRRYIHDPSSIDLSPWPGLQRAAVHVKMVPWEER